MQKFLVLLILLGSFYGLAEAHCRVRLFRSLDMSSLKIFINSVKFIHLRLVDEPEQPAIQYFVNKGQVHVFDKQARTEKKSLNAIQTSEDNVSRQFREYETQFRSSTSVGQLLGYQVQGYGSFAEKKFQIKWLGDTEYEVNLSDVPEFSFRYTESALGHIYKIKSPLYDLETRIDSYCRVHVFRQGVEVHLDLIERPHRSAQDWNPMDPNSWTLFDRQNRQAGSASSSSRGFRFARPLSPPTPSVPEEPAEPEPL